MTKKPPPSFALGGFTLIEVMLALVIISIGLTALMISMIYSTTNTQRIKEKTISHWVALQAVSMVQLGLLSITPHQETTQLTKMLGQRWYWRATTAPTPIPFMQEITILVSKNQTGPFTYALTAFSHKHD